MICTWIAYLCDSPVQEGAGQTARNSYSHAMKMRASLTFLYTYRQKRGELAILGGAGWGTRKVSEETKGDYSKVVYILT